MAHKVNDIACNEAGIVYVEQRDWDAKTRLLSSIKKAMRLTNVHEWFVENWENIKKKAEF